MHRPDPATLIALTKIFLDLAGREELAGLDEVGTWVEGIHRHVCGGVCK